MTLNNCLYCGKEFEPKRKTAKFCSDNCRKYYNSKPTVTQEVVINIPKEDLEEPVKEFKHTKTDQLFDDYRPGFYKFEGEPRNRECFSCDKKYTTRLDRLRFCSPTCQQKFLNKFA